MNRRIFLWPGEAPYSAESPGQAQPSVTEFRVPGSRGAVIVCPGGGYEVKVACQLRKRYIPHKGFLLSRPRRVFRRAQERLKLTVDASGVILAEFAVLRGTAKLGKQR